MDNKVTIKLPNKKEHKINQFGKRVIENWCSYAQVLAKRQRNKEKKEIVVSAITDADRQVYRNAYKKLMRERMKKQGKKLIALKKLASSRSIRSERSVKVETKVDDDYVACPIDYKAARLQSTHEKDKKVHRGKRSKTAPAETKSAAELAVVPVKRPATVKIALPPIKTKPWVPPTGVKKRKPKPVVIIPPFKTRPWNPCITRVKPRVKPVVNYPELTLRKM